MMGTTTEAPATKTPKSKAKMESFWVRSVGHSTTRNMYLGKQNRGGINMEYMVEVIHGNSTAAESNIII